MDSKSIKNKFTLKLLIAFRRMDTRKEGMSIKCKEDKETVGDKKIRWRKIQVEKFSAVCRSVLQKFGKI